jgi:hypothetical protein
MDMSEETYIKALAWAKVFQSIKPHPELNLAGIGESTLHPEFVRFVHLAREAVGPHVRLVLATNGLLMTDEMARAIAPAKPMVWVSLHRPEKAGPAVEILKRYDLIHGVSADPSIKAMDWAGQVQWHTSVGARRPCIWVRGGLVMVMADGRITRCCLDGNASGVIATVDDDLSTFQTSPYSLCKTCDQDVGLPMEAAA